MKCGIKRYATRITKEFDCKVFVLIKCKGRRSCWLKFHRGGEY